MELQELIDKQKLLMEQVPHGLRPDLTPKVAFALSIMSELLLYLGSCGHKPWRPNPLPESTQREHLLKLNKYTSLLYGEHLDPTSFQLDDATARRTISSLGIIEESLEYLESASHGTEAEKLEELTDMYFFLLEQTILSGFTLDQVKNEYNRKWAVNIKRYEDSKKGDTSWDKRATKDTL